jgi:hypothetical protein
MCRHSITATPHKSTHHSNEGLLSMFKALKLVATFSTPLYLGLDLPRITSSHCRPVRRQGFPIQQPPVVGQFQCLCQMHWYRLRASSDPKNPT